MSSNGDIITQFLDAMHAAGLGGAKNVIADGKWHRFQVDGDSPGSRNGTYKLHLDPPVNGQFGTWKNPGEWTTWRPEQPHTLTGPEREAFERTRRERDAELAKARESVAEKAKYIWDHSLREGSTAYLERKGVRLSGARISGTDVVVAARTAKGVISTLQFINEDGDKKFLKCGEKKGAYFAISKPKPDLTKPVIICEGFATGASIHAATELPVMVAFDAGNLLPVARALKEKYPETPFIIAADNDQWGELNTGVTSADQAAMAIGARLVIPQFKDTQGKPTDFNDLASREGLGEVARQILPSEPEQTSVAIVQTEKPDDLSASLSPTFITEISDWPFVTGGKNPKPVSNIENIRHILDLNGINVRYDIIRKDMQVTIPNESYLIDTEKNDKMTRIISLCLTAGLKAQKIEDFVAHIAAQNPYNPVAEWVLSKPWDKKSRMMDFFNTIQSAGESDESIRNLKNTILTRWMISAIAAAFNPNGISARGVLVFTGAQHIGKTNWFKNLVPQELRLTKDGMLLKPDDKDSVYQIVSNWLVELGEVDATFRKSDIAQLKAFITKSEDTIRLPYRRDPASFARRTVFFASVNDRDYLADPTGNTRFWTIECESINHTHGLDMQQVWAEFYALYKAGESWFMSHQETMALNSHNYQFQVVSPLKELIISKYDWDNDAAVRSVRPLTATEIAIELGYRNPNQKDTRSIASALRELNVPTVTSKGATRFKMPDMKIDPAQASNYRPWE